MRILLITAFLPLMACHASWDHDGARGGQVAEAKGTPTVRSYDASGFTGVDLRGPDDIQVKVGPAFSVRAEGDSKVIEQLDIRVENGVLRVGRKNAHGWSWGNHDDKGAKIYVTLPHLNSASVAGSGNLDADRGEGDFKADIAGSGNLNIASVQGGAVDLDLAGSGNLKVAGTANSFKASIAGSGDIDAKGLSASSATVSIAGSGNVRGTVHGDASVSLIGSGDAELGGGAHCKVSSMGSGEARCS